jgi:2-polyprenyl-6-methoxyphenol hydroxylase-like FAD-dependent oxidoreductase
MASEYDVVVVGGGLGGCAVAKVMASTGASLLLVERETRFKDRIRGEALAPWGVDEARRIGIYDALQTSCAHDVPKLLLTIGALLRLERDFTATTPQRLAMLTFYHPAMQEVMISEAQAAGAEVARGARVRAVQPGERPRVTIERDGRLEECTAQLVVCSDGRNSAGRAWGGFEVQHDRARMVICGVLLDGMGIPADTSVFVIGPHIGQFALLFPQGGGRVRAYLCYQHDAPRLSGESAFSRFVEGCIETGTPAEFYSGLNLAGPLATFDGADNWIEHPYREGIALIGDAAATSDPTWGQGLSLTLRDARVLTDFLRADNDWDAAAHAYAAEHDRYYRVIHSVEDWQSQVFFERGPLADDIRKRALPKLAMDPSRLPDHIISGPDIEFDASVRARFFGDY